MGSAFLEILPAFLPFALYALYLWYVRRQQAAHPGWRDAPWLWLIAAALLLADGSFVLLGLQEGAPPDAVYQPARILDGKIVPGELK